MSTTTPRKPRAPRKPSQAALREQAATAKAEATLAASTARVEAAEAAEEAATVQPSEADRKSRYITSYREAEQTHGSSKHAANVAAMAYFRLLPTVVTVTTAKSTTQKPVSVRERASQTLEALCVKVERDAKGRAIKGLDTIGYTVNRFSQLVDAFNNAEATGVIKVETLANAEQGDDVPGAEQVEALVSALDQAAVVGGKRAAEAVASAVREQVEADSGQAVGATINDDGDVVAAPIPSDVAIAVKAAETNLATMREAKKSQESIAPVVKTGSQIVADAVTVLWDAIEAQAANLDEGQKSALLGKMNALAEHAAKFLA